MKTISKKLASAIMTLSIVALTIVVGCSDSKIINDDRTALKIAINTHDLFSKSTAIAFFSVLVTEPTTGDTVGAGLLVLNGSFLEGALDSIPAEIPLIFTVQAMESIGETPTPGRVIYEGFVITSLIADQLNEIDVSMRPIVPMMNITPRYFDFTNLPQQVNTTFTFDVRVFNVDSLFTTTFRIEYDGVYCMFDSVALSSELLADTVQFFENNVIDIFPPQHHVQIAKAGIFQPIVDGNGDGTLVRFFFRTLSPTSAPTNLSTISVQVRSMAKSDSDNTIDVKTIEVDRCLLEFPVFPQ